MTKENILPSSVPAHTMIDPAERDDPKYTMAIFDDIVSKTVSYDPKKARMDLEKQLLSSRNLTKAFIEEKKPADEFGGPAVVEPVKPFVLSDEVISQLKDIVEQTVEMRRKFISKLYIH
jgi:hypothetical protein